MSDDARELVRTLGTSHQLALFAVRLRTWLLAEPDTESGEVKEYSESRARALLRTADVVDDPTLADFARLVGSEDGLRVALHDLLRSTALASEEEVKALAAVCGRAAPDEASQIPWLSLALAAHAWQRGYPLVQLDPSSPPERFSPAGQVVGRAAAFLRQQIQRGATERKRLASRLAARPDGSAALGDMQAEGAIPPLPPHFRPPIPVRYPEVSRETLSVDPDDEAEEPVVSRGESIVITEEDISEETPGEEEASERSQPIRMPPIRISAEQVQPSQQPPSPMPSSAVVMPTNTSESRPGLTVSLRQMFGSEDLSSTKLRVVAQEYPDGPGLYGLQVKVTCKGIKSFVAGTTNREGRFLAELPVREGEGLTYDVDLTWPREIGGETERKSITLHADRTEFTLPFYVRLVSQVRRNEDEQSS